MFQRVMVAVVCIPLIFLVFFGLPPICLPIMFAALSMIAVHEVLWSTGFVKNVRISGCSIVVSGLIPFWVYFGSDTTIFLCGLFVYFVFLFCEALRSNYTVTMEKMGGSFFFTMLIPFFLSSFIRIDQMGEMMGNVYIMMPLVSAFTSDAFALFAGMLFGKHKLAPSLSPKKTVEGSIGGFVGSVVCCLAYGALMSYCCHLQVNFWILGVYGLVGSAAAQIGDLSFSYIKRQYNLKDFGNILPGHGGVLDRFDSVIFCAPLTEIMIILLPALSC